MKIKLLKDLPDYKAGHVFEGGWFDDADKTVYIGITSGGIEIWLDYTKYPDFFQVIDEDEELIKEVTNHVFCRSDYSSVSSAIKAAIKYLRKKGRLE